MVYFYNILYSFFQDGRIWLPEGAFNSFLILLESTEAPGVELLFADFFAVPLVEDSSQDAEGDGKPPWTELFLLLRAFSS